MSWSASTRLFLRWLAAVGLVSPAVACHHHATVETPVTCPTVDASTPFVGDKPAAIDNCGECGLDCREVFPNAIEVECKTALDEAPACVVVGCPVGTHLLGEAFCAMDRSVLCMPCAGDADCGNIDPGAACLTLESGDRRCGKGCHEGEDTCAEGFVCEEAGGGWQCRPSSGICSCSPTQAGEVLGCRLDSPDSSYKCPGQQVCDGVALTACEPLYPEICDGIDNNCDGQVDEGFLMGGFYLTPEHCGACNHPCISHVPHMQASCVLVDSAPTCSLTCEPGFVDLDLSVLNGCECERRGGVWPPRAFGVDNDCDGLIDDMSDYVFVSKAGDDTNPGTVDAPLLTVSRGINLAVAARQTVVVSQGVYDERVQDEAGVSVVGGYRADFADRDTIIYPVVLTHPSGPAGEAVLVARGIRVTTEVLGLRIVGSGALELGTGSTTVLLDGCGPELSLSDLTVVAGDGQNGKHGSSAAAVLAGMGISSLATLDGGDGGGGGAGEDAGNSNCHGMLVSGGPSATKRCPVSGAWVSGGRGGDAGCPHTGCVVGHPCGNGGCSDYTVNGVCDFAAVMAVAVPGPPAAAGLGIGAGASGPLTYDAPTSRVDSSFCDDNPTLRREGGNGGDGSPGADGEGGHGFSSASGQLDAVTGRWRGGDGTSGGNGGDGGGGGGGTQGAGYDVIPGGDPSSDDHLGGSGGGGGSGGCGAPGATAGQGGGGSIGVAILLASGVAGPTFTDVRVVPARAGAGGDGGQGANGGAPGAGGLGGPGGFWCARHGGKGGNGGRGGACGGGGGGGGGSISGFHVVTAAGVNVAAYVQTVKDANSVDALPAPGRGGSGGYSPGSSGTGGLDGTAEAFRIIAP